MELVVSDSTARKLQALRQRLGRSYLFFGLPRVGKHTAATLLAKQLNCPSGGDDGCNVCRQIDAGTFPDVILVSADKKLGIAQIQQLQKQLDLSSYQSKAQRVVIVNGGNGITPEAQNCLLKTLEEPPPRTTVVLLAASRDALLSTVLSRVIPIHFSLLSEEDIAARLKNDFGVGIAQAAAACSQGRMGQALALAQDPKQLSQEQAIFANAKDLVMGSLFEKLVIIARLDDEQKRRLIPILFQQLRQAAQDGHSRALAALEQLQRFVDANVGDRVALESLAVQL